MPRGHAALAGVACLLSWGCGGAGVDETDGAANNSCGLANLAVGESCQPAGLPPAMCAPGELPMMDGGCEAAGVPPSRCPAGFTAADRGCYPTLPADRCTLGLMALAGETTCRPVAPCGATPYGDIPVETNTQYVDANWNGTTSDGSLAQPWQTIADAVAAAAPGAIVAIAPGSYVEHILIDGKPVRLWGKCPGEVEIVGTNLGVAAIDILVGATGAEVHDLAVTGPQIGIGISGATDVRLERVWLHDTGGPGVLFEGVYGPTGGTLVGSLVEGAVAIGVAITGADAEIASTAVRDTQQQGLGEYGNGITVQQAPDLGVTSSGHIVDTLVENVFETGIVIAGATGRMERVVVRDTKSNASGEFGMGVAFFQSIFGPSADGKLVESTLENNTEAGIVVSNSNGAFEAITVRGTQPSEVRRAGVGLVIDSPTENRSSVQIGSSLFEDNREVGVFVGASDAVLDGVLIRDITPSDDGWYGWGLGVQEHPMTSQRGYAELRHSVVQGSTDVAIFVGASDILVDASAIRDTVPGITGEWGVGLSVQENPFTGQAASANVVGSLIENSSEAGILIVGSQAEVNRTVVIDTLPNALGLHGDGITIVSQKNDASLKLIGSRIERSSRAGLSSFGAGATLETSALVCQSFDLDGEPYWGREHRFENLGNNGCGCSEPSEPCKAVTAGVAAPKPVDAYKK